MDSIVWKRLVPGGTPGLQNRRAASSMLPVCSTHTRFRQNKGLNWPCDPLRASPATFEAARDISSVTRYVCLMLCVTDVFNLRGRCSFLVRVVNAIAEHGKRPSCNGDAKIQSSCAEN